jgi:hypothetical protein
LDGTEVTGVDDADSTETEADGGEEQEEQTTEIEDMKAVLEGLGLGAFYDPLQNATPPHTSIGSLRALGVPEMASLADELGMDAGQVLRLSRHLRRPVTVKPCQYCKQARRHSSHGSWQEVLAGTVDVDLPAGSQPKWLVRFQRIRHWFDRVPVDNTEA